MIIRYAVYHMHLRWAIWRTTSNHCDRSWGDGTMSISSLSQVSNILPISVFVFGDGWYSTRWTTCIAANDQDTFICLSRGITWYSEKFILYACDFKNCYLIINSENLHTYCHSKMGNRQTVPIPLLPNQKFRFSIH